eukprot:5960343-Karenia_brevis.AAC.1
MAFCSGPLAISVQPCSQLPRHQCGATNSVLSEARRCLRGPATQKKISTGGKAARAVVNRLQPAPLCQRNKIAQRDGKDFTDNTR